jgi:hypothetical protein
VFCSTTFAAGIGIFGLAYALHTNFDLYGGRHTTLEPNPSLRAAVARRRSSGAGAAADVA